MAHHLWQGYEDSDGYVRATRCGSAMDTVTRHFLSATSRPFRLAIVGRGPLPAELVALFPARPGQAPFPWLEVVGVAPPDHDAGLPFPRSVPRFADERTLRETVADLDAILDLQPGAGTSHDGDVSRLTARTVVRFLGLLASTQTHLGGISDVGYSASVLRTLFDEVEEDIVLLDTNGVIVDMNHNAHGRKGMTKEELLGLSCWELEGSRFCCERKDGFCPFRQTMKTGQKAESLHTYVDDEGRMHYFRVYTYPLFDAGKTLRGVMEIRRDITTRTNMELKLQQSEKMAAIGELATYIAHEIRNPLFAIGGFANSLLRSTSLGAADREKVAIILQESKRLDRILKSTLNFARPTQGHDGVTNVNRLVADVMNLLGMSAENQGVTVRVESDADLPRVKADPELIKQCLINLVKNATEAMPDGGALVVRTSVREMFVRLEVEDTGPGIAESLRPKLFNPFFSTKDKGSGLGLAMTKKIVEELGGRIELHSQEGVGTRVALYLPPVLADAKKVEKNSPTV